MTKMALEDNQKMYENFMQALDKTKRPTMMASNQKLKQEVNKSMCLSNALTMQ